MYKDIQNGFPCTLARGIPLTPWAKTFRFAPFFAQQKKQRSRFFSKRSAAKRVKP